MKHLLVAVLLIAYMPACALAAASVSDQTPQASVTAQDPNLWDFGTVKAGSVLDHDFILTNNAQTNLAIKDTTTSCGCTASKIKNKILKPGESTTLSIKLNTKGYTGSVKQFVYVNTDSIENPVIRFIVTANVSP
jgi:hypothetical protein